MTGTSGGVLIALAGAGPIGRRNVEGDLECVAAGVPTLVEEPLGDTVEAATRLVEAAGADGVPLLTEHHRRHSPSHAPARRLSAGAGGGSRRRRGEAEPIGAHGERSTCRAPGTTGGRPRLGTSPPT